MPHPRTFRLRSSPMINTPDILRWAINGYKVQKERQRLLNIFTRAWPISDRTPTAQDFDRLLKGEVKWTEDLGSVDLTV
jgi:hypothetical protein